MSSLRIVIVGGGIGGLVTALSLHGLGPDSDLDVTVLEAVPEVKPLGVGINLLPHAVRELDALGLLPTLEASGITPSTLAYFSAHGQLIWDEPRGRAAGYAWPQLSIHRGELQVILHRAARDRLGPERVLTGRPLDHVEHLPDGTVRCHLTGHPPIDADIVVAADGIHSTIRRLRHPGEGMPRWNGALLYRGTVDTAPILDGRTMVWAGHPDQKFVAYPILDLPDGSQRINFIAEYRTHDRQLAEREDWNRRGDLDDIAPRFTDWVFDWVDVPALLHASPGMFVFPMVDRDPLDSWTEGRVTLLGDAAHPMYPIGSNGASQAILDARVLTGCLRSHPTDPDTALAVYESHRRPATGAIVLANRQLGPEAPMQLVHERAPDGFDSIDDVITRDEILAVTEGYRRTAGFALEALADGRSLADADYPTAAHS
jgi:2-polyprenyl-6-methoxyphenol hydroxylase-like FAD-dependent oxidoreductase